MYRFGIVFRYAFIYIYIYNMCIVHLHFLVLANTKHVQSQDGSVACVGVNLPVFLITVIYVYSSMMRFIVSQKL